MADTNETVADIIAEMRGIRVREFQDYADRLDAAHKREVDALNEQIADLRQQRDLWSKRAAELVEKCNEHYAKLKQVGNAAKLREAAVKIIGYLEPIRKWTMPTQENGTELTALFAAVDTVYQMAKAALAAPPRNCDVGVPEERIQRWSKFCKARSKKLPPIHGFEWEDYPYEEGGAK